MQSARVAAASRALLYSSGLRASELCGLDIADVDLDHATAIVTGKASEQRVIPIGKTALRLLKSFARIRPSLVCDANERALWLNGSTCRSSSRRTPSAARVRPN